MCLIPNLNDVFIDHQQEVNRSSSLRIDDSYCIVSLNKDIIRCSFFVYVKREHNCYYQINFSAKSSNQLTNLICRHKTIYCSISFCHAFYIGKEVYKAELAKVFKQRYKQS